MNKKNKGRKFLNKTIQTKRDTIVPATIFLIAYAAWAILVASENQFIQKFDQTVINIICNNNPAQSSLQLHLLI